MKRQKNAEFAQQKGREKRLELEAQAWKKGMPAPRKPPLFSHDATLQSYFNKGWHSVTPCDVRLHLGIAKTDAGTDLISKIRRFKQCHFSQ
ncbi:hypothetical protein N5280_002487 [Vibrio vulnificus]|uniref:hypothetical protein n=1 Tax=Vibrio vulnificus TaxID=672 RepID=UPI0010298CB5|nr:hypothetical protein [Vibrio vulnificus]EJV0369640.1 hypothetical protein [Vibrio vulnificus]RZQ46821.1 hypothetical protein D8T55_04630 [Vibrio vulnificus]